MASSRLAIENVESYGLLRFGYISQMPSRASIASRRGRFGVALPRAVTWGKAAAAGLFPNGQCDNDEGSVTSDCVLEGPDAVLTVNYEQCDFITESNHRITRNGSVVQRVSRPEFCSDAQTGPGVTVTMSADLLQTELDASSQEVARITAVGLVDRFEISGDDTCGAEGSETINGTIEVRCDNSAEGIDCPLDGSDVHLAAEDLKLTRAAGGSPCEFVVDASGILDFDDLRDGETFLQTFEQFQFREALEPGGSRVDQTGRLDVDCLGPVVFNTEQGGIEFTEANECPRSGALKVRRPTDFVVSDTGTESLRARQSAGVGAQLAGAESEQRFRESLYRAFNGFSYQVVQNATVERDLGADAMLVTTLVATLEGSLGACTRIAGALQDPQAIVSVDQGMAYPLDRIFKSTVIPDATPPCFGENLANGAGSVCIGKGCDLECRCPVLSRGILCDSFTLAGGVPITQESEIPAATSVESVASFVGGCGDQAGESTYRFGSSESGPTVKIERCRPAPVDDGFLLESFPANGFAETDQQGSTIIFAYMTPLVSLFRTGSAGFPIDVDGENTVENCAGENIVLTLGRADSNEVPEPRIVFDVDSRGMRRVRFDFDGNMEPEFTAPGNCGSEDIPQLSMCQDL